MGVEIKLPTISPQPYTHLPFEGYQYAREEGKGEAYTHRLFEAFFKEDKDIGDIEILTQLAEEVGLGPQAYRQAVESRKYKEQHRQAQQYGIMAVPTFQIGNRLFQGMIPKEQLRKLLKETARTEE